MKQTKIISLLLQNWSTKQIILNALYKSYEILTQDHDPSKDFQFQYYELTAILQAFILSEISHQSFPEIIPIQEIVIPWKDRVGVFNKKEEVYIMGSDISERKITDYQHHIFLLKFLIEQKLKHVIEIQKIIPKQKDNSLQIIEEKGLIFQKQETNYIKENIFFSTYTNEDQINFLTDSFKAIVELNLQQINHNDITFRNFLFSIKHKCWKVIDFDMSCNYQVFFKQNQNAKCYNQEKIRQSCPQTISSQGNYIRKNNELSSVYTLTTQQLSQLLKDSKTFYKQNNGKRDSIMYGLMVLKLLFNIKMLQIDKSLQWSVHTAIQKLVRSYQLRYKCGNPMKEQQFQRVICAQNFKKRHFELVKFIFENMMTQSCKNRKRLDEIAVEWDKIIQKLSEHQTKQTNIQYNQAIIKKQFNIHSSDHKEKYYYYRNEEDIKTPYDNNLSFTYNGQNDIKLPGNNKKKSSGIK